MMLQIFLDHLLGDVAGALCTVPDGPEVTTNSGIIQS